MEVRDLFLTCRYLKMQTPPNHREEPSVTGP